MADFGLTLQHLKNLPVNGIELDIIHSLFSL